MTTAGRTTVDFPGQGEMARRMSDLDWSTTSVGPPETWSSSLRTAVEICLGSRFPIVIFWGRESAVLYNDAYRPMLGDRKHPQFIGRPAEECWNEIWPTIGPMLAAVLDTGEATWSKDLLLPMVRNGFLEEAYFTFSYSPIPDGDGVGGVFCAVQETTEQVLGRRRLLVLRDLSVDAPDAGGAARQAVAVLERDPLDVPFAVIAEAGDDGAQRILAATSSATSVALPDALQEALARVQSTGSAEMVDAAVALGTPGAGAWSETPTSAYVLPIGRTSTGGQGGVVVGLSAGLAFDDAYRRFCSLVADQIASAMARTRVREEEHQRVEALAEIDRAKTAFFSNVSHEFRTPLTLMLGPLADLHRRLAGTLGPEDEELLTMAERNGRRLLRLVNTLLDFSRIEAGRVTAMYEPVDLAADTASVAAMFRSAFERAGVELVVDCPPLPAEVFVDREMWEKIVANLVSNAFKFTFEGSVTVRLRPTKDGTGAVLTVADTGVGVPADEVPRLFERFHRVEGARGRTHEGSGIGLALVHELVRMHGGRIDATSTEGVGTTLEIVLPFGAEHLPQDRVRPREATPSPSAGADVLDEILRWLPDGADRDVASLDGAATRSRPGPTDGAHILLADDNPDMREYLRRLLGERWVVTAVPDGAEALETARRDPPDLVVSDIMMPKVDGIGLLQALRAGPATSGIPVILLSARAGEEARIEGLEAGADDYVVKPFSARELVARVQARLEIATAREGARLAAERERRALYELFMQAPVPICTLRGDDFVFEMANEPYLRATGLTDVVGKRLVDVLPEAHDQGFADLLRDVLRTGEPYVGIDVPVVLHRPDGPREEFFTFVYSPMRDMDGTIEGVMVVATLVTEQVRARRVVEDALAEQAALNRTLAEQRSELERANAAKDEFLGLVSHELRTPITTIFGNAEVLRTRFDHLDRDTQTAAIADISAEAERLHGIIENLLVLARGTQADQMEPVLVDRIVERMVRLHREQHPGREIELVVAAYRTTIDGSPIQVEQVIRNLLSNAEKYSPQDSPITVALAQGPDSLRIEVQDRGIGFEGGAPPMLFTPFYRSEAAAARAAGVGIGLVVCKRIVEALGGTIRAGARPGGGAVFAIELPLAQMDREEALLA